jgi:hypothetical protein
MVNGSKWNVGAFTSPSTMDSKILSILIYDLYSLNLSTYDYNFESCDVGNMSRNILINLHF